MCLRRIRSGFNSISVLRQNILATKDLAMQSETRSPPMALPPPETGSRWRSQNSKPCSKKPPHAPLTTSGASSEKPSTPSNLTNAGITSLPPDMNPSDRNLLWKPAWFNHAGKAHNAPPLIRSGTNFCTHYCGGAIFVFCSGLSVAFGSTPCAFSAAEQGSAAFSG